MKWFLMAVMTATYNGGLEKDTFIWSNPTFNSVEECKDFVKNNNVPIFLTLKQNFPNDEMDRLLCVNEEKLKKFLQEGPVPNQPQRGTDA